MKRGLKLPKGWSFYIVLFFVLSWAIVHYTYLGYWENVKWLIWSFVVSMFCLFFVWFSYSYVVSKKYKLDLEKVLKKDIISYLPLISLFLKNSPLFTISIIAVISIKIYFLPIKIRSDNKIPIRKFPDNKIDLLILLLIAIGVTLIFLQPIFKNFDYLGVHDWDQHSFWNGVPRKTILEYGQFPLWNPYSCGGNVMLANPQSAFLSPLYLLVLLFGVVEGLKLSIIFHMIIGICGMYILSRYMGISKLGSYLSSFIFMLSSYFISHVAVGHTTFLPIAYIPFVFYYYLKSLSNLKYIVVCSLFLLLMFFEGGIYPFPYMALFLFLYSLFELIRSKNLVYIRNVFIVFLIVILVGAVKFLPVAELTSSGLSTKYSADPGFDTEILINSLTNSGLNKLPFLRFAFFENQFAFWHEYYSYIGVLALVLSLLGIWIFFKKEWPLAVSSLIFIILSYGSNSILNLWELIKILPVFSFLHAPSRFIIIAIFCFSIFAGFFVNELLKKKLPKLLIIILICYVLFNLIYVNSPIIDDKFTIEPAIYKPNETFHHKINKGMIKNLSFKNRSLINSTIISEMYPYLMMNVGTLNCYEKVHLPIAANTIQDGSYSGEAYYLYTNKTAEIIFFSPNKIILKIDVKEPNILVVNQNYHKDWKSKKRKIKNYGGLISVNVFPEDEILQIYYLPTSFIAGTIITLIGLVFSVIFYFSKNLRKFFIDYFKKIYKKKSLLKFVYKNKLFAFSIILFVLIPSFFVTMQIKNNSIVSFFISLCYQTAIFLFIVGSFFILNKIIQKDILRKLIAFSASVYYLVVSFIISHWIYTKNKLDLLYFFDSYRDILHTGKGIFGDWLILLIVVFITLFIIYFIFFLKILKAVKNTKIVALWHVMLTICVVLLIISFIHSSYGYMFHEYMNARELNKARSVIFPYFPNNSMYDINSEESVFILQLESGNSMALLGNFSFLSESRDISRRNMAYFYNIAKKGVFFPFFWANSIQTNRAHENILCGINNNIGESFSYRPDEISLECMPDILNKSGYNTLFFRSDDLLFANMGEFEKNIGFSEIHYKELFKENDTEYHWGYDDCTFYKRSFEYLNEYYPNGTKLFVVFEVSSHHYPWEMKEEYSFFKKFNPPNAFIEKYINSYLVQDYCFSKFYEEFKKFNSKKSHLFVLHDTSFPVGNKGIYFNEEDAYNDNFLTPSLYIPPESRRSEFEIGKEVNKIYSHTDIMPTIFELLNNKNYQNSFAFELKKDGINNNYEDCQILIQPYSGGKIVVIKGMNKYVYDISEKRLLYYNLSVDWYENNEKVISEKMSYIELKKDYYCERYK